MSTQFTNRQWRLPNNENKDKQSNYSMDFDGSSQYIELNSSVLLPNQHTISTWIKSNDLTSSAIGYVFSTETTIKGIGLDEGDGSFGAGKFYYWNGGSPTTVSTTAITVNNWHHIVFVFDSTANEIKFYLDGNLDKTTTVSIGTAVSLKRIGTYDGNLHYLNGKLDAFSIFDYALTDGTGGTVNQIAALYGSSSTGIGNPMAISGGGKPVAYYPLGDQDSFNGADYLVPNSSLKDYVFDFDGNDYIDIVNSSTAPTSLQSLGNSNSYSISSWINTTTTDTYSALWFAGKTILEMRNEGTTGIHVPFNLSVSSGKLFFGRSSNYTTSYENYSSTTDVNTGSWVHCIATVDNNTLKFYINGSLDSTHTFTTATGDCSVGSNTSNFFIGSRSTDGGGNDAYFDGSLSNAQIFNTALPETGSNSVETLYNNGSPLTSMTGFTSLQGWWKLDASATYDGSDWTIPDDSSNSNDGTSSGMTQSALQQSDLSFKTSYSPYALDFDGATYQRVEIPNYQNNFPSNQIFTISTWVRINSASNYCFWGINGTGDNALYTYVTNGTGLQIRKGNTTSSNIPNVLTIGEWANVVAVFDSTINCKLYINNVFIQDITTASLNTTNTNDFFIGAGINQYYVLDHSQSNLSIWNAALTSAQVTEIYSEGVPQNLNNHSAYSNLTNWWQLGSNSSYTNKWICLDEKGTNNGESVNMTEDDIIDGVNSYANGLSSGMGGDEVIGDAPYSSSNSLSVNMDVEDRTTDTPS